MPVAISSQKKGASDLLPHKEVSQLTTGRLLAGVLKNFLVLLSQLSRGKLVGGHFVVSFSDNLDKSLNGLGRETLWSHVHERNHPFLAEVLVGGEECGTLVAIGKGMVFYDTPREVGCEASGCDQDP